MLRCCTYFFSALWLCILGAAEANDYQNLIARQKPVAYYTFSDAVLPGGDRLSSLGSVVFTNTVWYPMGRGTIAGAVGTNGGARFAGRGVSVPQRPELNPWPCFTVELWAQYGGVQSAPSGYGAVAGSYSGERQGWVLYVNPSGEWELRIGGGEAGNCILNGGKAVENEWVQLVVSYDGALAQLYRDASRVGEAVFYAGMASGDGFGLGQRGDNRCHWTGGVDEFALYGCVLTAGEIAEHYALRTQLEEYRKAVLALNPLVYWPLDEAVPNSLAVNSAPGEAGAEAGTWGCYRNGAAPSAVGPGVPGFRGYNPALCLTTNRVDCVEMYFGESVRASQEWTFTCWVKPPDVASEFDAYNRVLFGHTPAEATGGEADNFSLYCCDDEPQTFKLAYNWGTSGKIELGAELSKGVWSFLAFTIRPEEAVLWLHDGTNECLTAVTNRMLHAPQAWTGRFKLGAAASAELEEDIAGTHFWGGLDEWCVFNRALTQSEIELQFHTAMHGSEGETERPVLGYSWSEGGLELNWDRGTLAWSKRADADFTLLPEAKSPHRPAIQPEGMRFYVIIDSD